MKSTCVVSALSAALLPCILHGAALTLGEASLSGDQLTVPVTVNGSEGGDLKLYIGEAGPRDGDPAATVEAGTAVNVSDGVTTFTVQISVGARIAYKAVLGYDESDTGMVTATDTSEYIWVNDAKGSWHDPGNWTRRETATDGYKNIGYPAYTTGQVRFNGGQTAEVTVDADYSFGDFFVDNPNLSLTIHGNGHTLNSGNTHTTSDNSFVFDGVRFITSGTYSVGSRSSMRMVNGSYFQTEWEFNVNGTGAYLYVGSGSEIYAGSGYWWTFRLDGDGALVELDNGYIHSRGFRIGQQRSNATPRGFVIKGASAKLEFAQEFVVCAHIPSNPVFEFVVPIGGYASAPIVKRDGGNFQFGGSLWQDHGDDANDYTPVAFRINEYSPFYQGEDAYDGCLVDWSASALGIRDGGFVLLNTIEDSATDYLYTRKANGNGETQQDQIWVHLTGTGIPADLPAMNEVVAASADSSSATATFVATITSFTDNPDYESTLELWAAIGGPKDDLEANLAKVATLPVTAAGDYTFAYGGMLGAKVLYKVALATTNGAKTWDCGSSALSSVVIKDDHARRYNWKNGVSGLWSDPDNWTIDGEDDGRARIGYPTWGANVGFYSTTSAVTIDADYEDIHEIILGWGGADLTFASDAEGVVRTVETGNFRDGQYANVKVTLDAVAFDTLGTTYPGAYNVKANSSLTMLNGARVRTKWAVVAEGENAYMYVGTNCLVTVSAAEPYHRLGLAGANAEIVIDGGTVDALYLAIAKETDTANCPKGITFSGANPRLLIRDNMGGYPTKVYGEISGSPVFSFTIPAGGYVSTPIVRTGNNGNTVFARDSSAIPPVVFRVERSPYEKVRGDFDQQLLDWSSSSAETKLDVGGVAMAAMPRGGEGMFFTPAEGDSKSGVAARCVGTKAFTLFVR